MLLIVNSFAQDHAIHEAGLGAIQIFGLLELPFLIIAVIFSFLTASRLKGGKFGKGMNLIAWGFLVMAIGHIHMQLDHIYGYNLFNELLGMKSGRYAWFIALIGTWVLSILGFYRMFKASKL